MQAVRGVSFANDAQQRQHPLICCGCC
jgi:hypothetical protein